MRSSYQTKEGWHVLHSDINRSRDVASTGRLDWDRDMLDWLSCYIRPDDVVVDIGASIGDCTIAFMEMVGPNGFVVAYEPHRLAYKCLTANCRGTNIVMYPYGVGDDYKHLGMKVMDATDEGTSYLTENGAGDHVVVNLDQHSKVWPNQATGGIDFMKIDVEGMELEVLIGARQLIMKSHPILFVECYSQALARYHTTVHSIKAYLQSMGYDHFQIYEPYKDWHWDYFNVLATV